MTNSHERAPKRSTLLRCRKRLCAALVSVALLQFGCVTATAVRPAPLSAQEQATLTASLRGHWKCTHTKEGSDAKEPIDVNVQFTFNDNGTFRHQL